MCHFFHTALNSQIVASFNFFSARGHNFFATRAQFPNTFQLWLSLDPDYYDLPVRSFRANRLLYFYVLNFPPFARYFLSPQHHPLLEKHLLICSPVAYVGHKSTLVRIQYSWFEASLQSQRYCLTLVLHVPRRDFLRSLWSSAGKMLGKWPSGLLLVEPHDHQDYYNLPALENIQTKNSKEKLLVNPSAFPENLAAWPVMKLGKPPTIPGAVLTFSHFKLLTTIANFKAFPASNIRSSGRCLHLPENCAYRRFFTPATVHPGGFHFSDSTPHNTRPEKNKKITIKQPSPLLSTMVMI